MRMESNLQDHERRRVTYIVESDMVSRSRVRIFANAKIMNKWLDEYEDANVQIIERA